MTRKTTAQLVASLEERGWQQVGLDGAGHVTMRPPYGVRLLHFSGHLGNRAVKNVRAKAKRLERACG